MTPQRMHLRTQPNPPFLHPSRLSTTICPMDVLHQGLDHVWHSCYCYYHPLYMRWLVILYISSKMCYFLAFLAQSNWIHPSDHLSEYEALQLQEHPTNLFGNVLLRLLQYHRICSQIIAGKFLPTTSVIKTLTRLIHQSDYLSEYEALHGHPTNLFRNDLLQLLQYHRICSQIIAGKVLPSNCYQELD